MKKRLALALRYKPTNLKAAEKKNKIMYSPMSLLKRKQEKNHLD
jgi:hypothetical protein